MYLLQRQKRNLNGNEVDRTRLFCQERKSGSQTCTFLQKLGINFFAIKRSLCLRLMQHLSNRGLIK
jgi:hypothetical protein